MPTVRAWCRVDLAGGTLDIWPLGLLHPGARTVNLAIDLAVTVALAPAAGRYRVRQGDEVVEAATAAELARSPAALAGVVAEALELPPFTAELASDSPRGAGLGASSALAVALITATEVWLGHPRSAPAAVAALARDLEARLMGLPTGVQDHYPALLGGALEIAPVPGGERVRALAADLDALGDSLLVVYSGVSHFSAGQNWQVVRRRLDGEPEMIGLFAGIAAAAAEVPAALEAGDLPRVGELMTREWSYRRHLADGVSTPELESLLALAASLGAWGGKACGAGGGGSVALLCPPERRPAIAAALESAGGRVLPARPARGPLAVEG
jgi:D-glycero-alpha-D-manno-heptose-7-phosphate kinase